jgi:hypothetical protein
MEHHDNRRAEQVSGGSSSEDLSLTSTGVTLLGVLLSVGVTVGFGIDGPWWFRVLAGAGTSVGLMVLAARTTSSGRGRVAKLANWVIGARR